MKSNALMKTLIFFSVVVTVVISGVGFAFLHKEDLDNRIQFSLTNQEGQPVTHQHYSGQHLLVFFGFTHCQHICPMGMHRITKIMNELEQEGINQQIKPIFISVDSNRDTPERIATFIDPFHPNFDGLTGSTVSVKKTANSFKTYFEEKISLTNENYDVTHSSMIYVVDPFHRIVGTLSSNLSVSESAEQLKGWIL